jgi:hypothetical protein|tara:strand:- start:2239 stop:2835 length:597 start_codon:yes stop_codon:yes gene_type:complete
MKILAFTDIHGNNKLIEEIIKKSKARKPDLLVCCGDLTIFGSNLEKILFRLNKIKIPILAIPGNHEEEIDMKRICRKFDNIIYLHKGVYEIGEYAFFGFGTGGFEFRSLEFEKICEKVIKRIGGKNVILITHQPPHKTKLDRLEYFDYAGNKSFKAFIVKHKPMLALSGHLHENFGKIDNIGKSILINPGPKGKIIKI